MSEKKSNFTGKIGFVLAAAGSAVGLGNIWRFPYLAARYGGGLFLLIYVLLAVTFGFALMCAEIAIGRKTGKSAISAFGALNKKYSFIGWLVSVVPMIILSYYSVIGGWVAKYFWVFVSGDVESAASNGYFEGFISQTTEPLVYFFIFIGITAVIVLFGVEKGIEKVSKIMMPLLVILTIFVAGYSMFMPGAFEGVIYYLKPDFSRFSVTAVLAAMGQLFYSMSIAMGILITYGSYTKKDINLESSVKQIELFDTGIAFLAGLIIIPAVFSFSGGDESVLGKGAGLMFETLPKVFNSMMGGRIIGLAFFLLVFLAALTSSISLMETVVSVVQDKFGFGRKKSCFLILITALALGIPSSLSKGTWSGMKILGKDFFDFLDAVSNSVIMPIIALLTCIFVGYVVKPKVVIDEIELNGKFKNKKMFVALIKYIAPICIVAILIFSMCEAFFGLEV